jgi:transposase
MVELLRSGRTPEKLAREFEPTAQSISTWVKQAERDCVQVRGTEAFERRQVAID